MKTPIARSIASTVKTSVVGTLWSMKRARKRNAPAAVVAEGTAAVAADAVATAAAVVVEAAAEIEVIVATAATAGN